MGIFNPPFSIFNYKVMANIQNDKFKKLVAHCKEYGFIFQSSEVYDGLAAVYDYGPNGVELKNNLKEYWWKAMVQMHDNIVGIDTAIFMHPTTWKASGHVDAFNDPLIDNKDSNKRYRADVLVEDFVQNKIMAKAEKEVSYHAERSADLVIRLGDGTSESHDRMQAALDLLYPYVGELFVNDATDSALAGAGICPEPETLRDTFDADIDAVLSEATLTIPDSRFAHQGGKSGVRHSEHLGHLLTQMQWLQRAYPGATW